MFWRCMMMPISKPERWCIVEGNALAGVDSVDLTVRGVSGHGGHPEAKIRLFSPLRSFWLQTIVSREIPPIEPAVLTVGSIHGGTKHNIIPDEVRLQLSVRYYSDTVRATILDGIERISKNLALAAGSTGPFTGHENQRIDSADN